MQIKLPQPFTFEAGKRAVLLLHGFTGNSADVRMLGRYLEKQGYTVHAPIYRGHGRPPEELIQARATDWWEDVQAAYDHLLALGYEEIAIAGLSLGGALGLKLASERKTKAIITMCTPTFFDNEKQLTQGFELFVKQYKQLERKDAETIARELADVMAASTETFASLQTFIESVKDTIDLIYTPAMIIQASEDEMINPESANFIYNHIESDQKIIKWYEESGHAITFGPEKDKLHADIYAFLESLDWQDA